MKTENMDQQDLTVISWFDDRYYKRIINDEILYYPSVTTKLGIISKYGLDRWRGDIGNREADLKIYEAQNKGKRIHKAWEVLGTGGTVYYDTLPDKPSGNYFLLKDQDEMLAVHKLQLWCEALKFKMVYSEMNVYSDSRREAGTMDNLIYITAGDYVINGKKPVYLEEGYYIVDLKTGKEIYDEAFYQVAAYASFCVEMGFVSTIAGGLIVHTNAKTKTGIEGLATKVIGRDELLEHYKTYCIAADLWNRKNPSPSPYIASFPAEIKIAFEYKTITKKG